MQTAKFVWFSVLKPYNHTISSTSNKWSNATKLDVDVDKKLSSSLTPSRKQQTTNKQTTDLRTHNIKLIEIQSVQKEKKIQENKKKNEQTKQIQNEMCVNNYAAPIMYK